MLTCRAARAEGLASPVALCKRRPPHPRFTEATDAGAQAAPAASASSQPSSSTPALQACDSVSSMPFGWKHSVW